MAKIGLPYDQRNPKNWTKPLSAKARGSLYRSVKLTCDVRADAHARVRNSKNVRPDRTYFVPEVGK